MWKALWRRHGRNLLFVLACLLLVPALLWAQASLYSGNKGGKSAKLITATDVDANTAALDVNCVSGCSSVVGAQLVNVQNYPASFISADAVANQTTTAIHGFTFMYNGATWDRVRGDTTNGIFVNCKSGCSGSSFSDNTTFASGVTAIGFAGGVFDDASPTACTEDSGCAPRMSSRRELYLQLRDAAGNERGVNVDASNRLQVNVGNTASIPVTATIASGQVTVFGTLAVTGPLTNTELRATSVPVIGPLTNAELRAASVPVIGPLTNTELRAASVPITGAISGAVTVSGTVTANVGTFPGNTPFNLAQVASITVTTASGPATTGTLRVSIASDQTAIPVSGTVIIGSMPDNEPINLAQVGGATVDSGGVSGSLGVGGTDANNATIAQNPMLLGCETIASGVQPTAATAGNLRRVLCTTEGVVYVTQGNSQKFRCLIALGAVSVTECQKAPVTNGLFNYITNITITATSGSSPGKVAILSGTGTNCATGRVKISPLYNFTNASGMVSNLLEDFGMIPLTPTSTSAVCASSVGVGATFDVLLIGYIAP